MMEAKIAIKWLMEQVCIGRSTGHVMESYKRGYHLEKHNMWPTLKRDCSQG